MATPFILVTTHRVEPDRASEIEDLAREFAASIAANEPRAISFQLSLDETGTELTHILVEEDAEAMDEHFRISGGLIGRALEAAPTTAIHAIGEPGPVLRQVLQANTEAGVPVSVRPRRVADWGRRIAETAAA